MNRSKERHTFQADSYVQRCEEKGEEPREDYLELYRHAQQTISASARNLIS